MVDFLKSKKGFQVNDVPMLVITLLIIAVVIGIGVTVLSSMQQTSQCDDNWDEASSMCYSCATGDSWHSANATCYNSTGAAETAASQSRTLAFNATQSGADALEDLSDWQTTWAVIVAAAVVIGIISAYLFFKR